VWACQVKQACPVFVGSGCNVNVNLIRKQWPTGLVQGNQHFDMNFNTLVVFDERSNRKVFSQVLEVWDHGFFLSP
jgi:hypothetical protein